MEGILELADVHEPLRSLKGVDTLEGRQIALKMTGGIGDCLISIGGSAGYLASAGAMVTAIVLPHQGPFLLSVVGVSAWIAAQKFNRPQIQSQFDVVVDFANTFNSLRELRSGGYYSLVSDRIGFDVKPGRFEFERERAEENLVCLHPTASNPNRRWNDEKWRELAYQFRDRGCLVVWLGTCDEYGFSDDGIRKASDQDESLKGQAELLATASYFVGCDSGFAHMAGMLDIEGSVLFGNTNPADVIGDYPTLRGVHCFKRLSLDPSLSLRKDDKRSRVLMDAITVDDVVMSSPLSAIECTPGPRTGKRAMRARLAVVGSLRMRLIAYLSRFYEITRLLNLPEQGTEFDAVVEIRDENCRIRTRDGIEVTAPITDFEDVRRAIRETLNR